MSGTISNDTQLKEILLAQCRNITELLSQRVYETLNFFLNQYYDEWEGEYERTNDFLYSAIKTQAKQIGNGFQAYVYIDYESMNDYENATGFQVATWANEKLHGGFNANTGTRVWDDTIDNTVTNGDLLKLAIEYLKSKGFTVIA